jgi:uncharacterized membrane protein
MNWKSITICAIAAIAVLMLATAASAQSCALCYTQAASSGNRMIPALRYGILVLVAPPTLMTIGAIFVCYRKRDQTREDSPEDSDYEW